LCICSTAIEYAQTSAAEIIVPLVHKIKDLNRFLVTIHGLDINTKIMDTLTEGKGGIY